MSVLFAEDHSFLGLTKVLQASSIALLVVLGQECKHLMENRDQKNLSVAKSKL